MDAPLTQLGVGGIVAFLIIKEVLNFLRSKKQNGSSGSRQPEYWILEFGRIMDDKLKPTIANQERIIRQLEEMRK